MDYIKFKKIVSNNKLWKDDLVPIYPLEKNMFIINKREYNNKSLINDLNIAISNSNWVNKGNKSGDWQSITLKSYSGNDQSFLINTNLGKGKNNNYKYTQSINGCNYFKSILESIPTDVYLVRILKLKSNSVLDFHTDEFVFKNKEKIIRCHLPIITNENVKFQIGYPLKIPEKNGSIWESEIFYERYLYPNYLWYTNVNTIHGAVNNSNIDRYHLVIDMCPTSDMIKYIYG